LQASDPNYERWRDELAALGMVVVSVEFRNGGGKLGNHPFPAGLNDCMSGLQWTFDNRAALGISKIVVSGESGGGNLSLAVTLKSKMDGKIDQIAGTYAMCPYISNAWAVKKKELTSLYENDDLFLNCGMMGVLADVYDPEHKNDNNPLCWPYFAKKEDLQGLPPHVISVNQLDPLRDEGLKYFQMLLSAGVSAYSRTVNGTCHAGDIIFRKALPEAYRQRHVPCRRYNLPQGAAGSLRGHRSGHQGVCGLAVVRKPPNPGTKNLGKADFSPCGTGCLGTSNSSILESLLKSADRRGCRWVLFSPFQTAAGWTYLFLPVCSLRSGGILT
jgi:acetyl esterase/lipase